MDSINYVLFKNPLSASVINSVKSVANNVLFKESSTSASPKLPSSLEKLNVTTIVHSGNPFLRLAGVSGAAATLLGAYGAHAFLNKEGYEERKKIYEIANNYHFLHSLLLCAVPLSRQPKIAGTFITMGILLFSGTCYYDAFTGKNELRKLTPIGGTCLIIGWLCLVF